jgi:hypothetical protein
MGSFWRRLLVFLAVGRLGMRYPLAWRLGPFFLLAVGVLGFTLLADHYEWTGGTALLIGLLMLSLFVVIVGPLTLLPNIYRRMAELDQAGKGLGALLDDMLESLRSEKTSGAAESHFQIKD